MYRPLLDHLHANRKWIERETTNPPLTASALEWEAA